MRKTKIAFGAVLAVALLFSSVGEAAWLDEVFDVSKELEAQLFERDGKMMLDRFHGGIEAPAGWERMSVPERRNVIRGKKGAGNEGMIMEFEKMEREFEMILPEDWGQMSPKERRQYRFENKEEMRVKRMDELMMRVGASGEDMDDDMNMGQHMSAYKQVRNLVRKAEKGKNFKKFTGQLKPRKSFADQGKMRNPLAVAFMQQRGIMEGYEDGTFGADRPINRVESLKVLLESLGIAPVTIGESGFDDVDEDAWYSGYVKSAKRRGFVEGYDDGTFRPDRTVNQAELLKLAFESFGIDLSEYEVMDLPEGAEMNAWYAPYLQYALDNDLLDEEDVDLGEGMTREMFAEVISRLIKQQEELEDNDEGDMSDDEDEMEEEEEMEE